jgi:hypothetical protein
MAQTCGTSKPQVKINITPALKKIFTILKYRKNNRQNEKRGWHV